MESQQGWEASAQKGLVASAMGTFSTHLVPRQDLPYSGSDHSCVPMVAHVSGTVSVAEGAYPGFAMYV